MYRQRLRDSDTLLTELLKQRQALIKGGVSYEQSYFHADARSAALDDQESELVKQYILSTGEPGARVGDVGGNRKMGSVYVGCSRRSISSRLRAHNGEGIGSVKKGTRRSANDSKWKLCLVLFLPAQMTMHMSTKTMRDYLRTAHKIEGKIRRSLQVARLFNLRYHVPPALSEFVDGMKAEVQASPPLDDHDFRSSATPLNHRQRQ